MVYSMRESGPWWLGETDADDEDADDEDVESAWGQSRGIGGLDSGAWWL